MADTKITGLTVGVPISTDVIPYVSDPGGSPVTKKTLVSSLTTEFLYNNTEYLFRCPTPGGVSAFTALISSVGGSNVVYKAPITGTEAALVVSSTGQLAKLRLYNTTRGNYALISQSVVATKTITLTAAVPVGWAANDTIVITSQTVSGGSLNWVDLQVTHADLIGKSALGVDMTCRSATAADNINLHPTETYGDGKLTVLTVQVANVSITRWAEVKLTSNVLSFAWGGTAHTAIIIKVMKYFIG